MSYELAWCEGKSGRGWRKEFNTQDYQRAVIWREGYVTGTGPSGTVYRQFLDQSLICRIHCSNVKASGALEAGGQRDLEAFNRALAAVQARLGLRDDQMEQLVNDPVRKVIPALDGAPARVLDLQESLPGYAHHG